MRFFLTRLFVLALFIPAEAQQPKKVPRVGILNPESAPSPRIEEFRSGLHELGYSEGRNIILEYRYANGKRERLPELAANLVRLRVDVIYAPTTLAAIPAKKATSTIPIVMVSGEPVETGLVSSFAHPGGNVTGLANFSPDLIGKRPEFIKEVMPDSSRVGVLWDSGGPAKILRALNIDPKKTALKSSGRSLQSSETFVSELSLRTSTDVTAQGTVASPARLPQPFQVAPDAGDTRYRTGASKSNSSLFSEVSICQGVMFSRRPPDLVNSRSLHDWPKDRLLWPKDRIYFSSAKN